MNDSGLPARADEAPAPYVITSATPGAVTPAHHQVVTHVARTPPDELLADAEVVTLPSGRPVYVVRQAPTHQPMPAWAKGTALVMVSGGTGIGVAAGGLALLVPVLAGAAPALALIGCSVAAAGVGIAAVMRPRHGASAGGDTATATATAQGRTVFGGKVVATATATITKK